MTSLSETYGAKGSRARKRLLAGTGLFLAGAFLVVVGIVVASTGILSVIGVGTFGAREVAGIVAGLGVPAVFVGVFIVLPASQRERAAAAIGSAIAILGVILFAYAYPDRWASAYGVAENDLTFPVVTIYFIGVLTTFWALFTAIVNVKVKQPGGTVTLKRIIRQVAGTSGSHRPGSKPSGYSGGSVGIAGSLGEEDVSATVPGATSDGGTEAEVLRSPESTTDSTKSSDHEAETDDDSAIMEPKPEPDPYCGNCTHFEYVRDGGTMTPYCGFHEELMEDMEACPEWEPNTWAKQAY